MTFLSFRRIPLLTLATFFSIQYTHADNDIEVVEVHGQRGFIQQNDVTSILREEGVQFSAAGGISALPVLNGLMGDRTKVLVDGMDVTAACANQMNPPLSYLSADQIGKVAVVAGISPVSMGGDNIAGVIAISGTEAHFTDARSLQWQGGSVSALYQSNFEKTVLSAKMQGASDWLSLNYDGTFEDASSFSDGHGDTVFDTLYRAENHRFLAGIRGDKQALTIRINHQYIPFQGFPNQYMDMTHNVGNGVSVTYTHELGIGNIEARLNWHQVEHRMGFFTPEKTGMMPMNTESDDSSAMLHYTLPTKSGGLWTLGAEWYLYQIEDWWPAIAGSMMMGPHDFINIHDGERKRTALFAEYSVSLQNQWQLSAGIRAENVTTDAGDVAPYNAMPTMGMPNLDYAASQRFNQRDRTKDDTLIDSTVLLTIPLNQNHQFELGMARKNRAPNLYERYSWGRGTMAMTMVGWFGDGNGYTGHIDLSPETALTASVAYQFSNDVFEFSFSPYYTKVSDYIDAKVIGSFSAMGRPGATRNLLQFTNEDATLYGFNTRASWLISDSAKAGSWRLTSRLRQVRGSRDDTGESLYQMAPASADVTLLNTLGQWQHFLRWEWSDSKTRTDPRRLENATDHYQLISLGTDFTWRALTVSLKIDNLFDTYYTQPLGGVSVADFRMQRADNFIQLAGPGRAISVGIRATF